MPEPTGVRGVGEGARSPGDRVGGPAVERRAVIRRRMIGDAPALVAVVEIDRHKRRNALDVAHLEELHDAVVGAHLEGARTLVVTGLGSSVCAGADLGTGDGVYGDGFRDALYRTLSAITELPVPVVAAVNGPAIRAGTQLAIACDLRVAAHTARFAVPTARNGLAVDPWTIHRLAVLAGGATTRAMLLGCDTLDATDARTRGLADRLGDLDDALAWAHEIAGLAPLTLAYSKRAVDRLAGSAMEDPELATAFVACWDSDDLVEAQRARAEKRAPRFAGR